jgi:predicted amidohydrolase YtcJ
LQEAIQAVGNALAKQPWPDHRTIFEHAPLTNDELMIAIMNLKTSANFFINHVYYYGDELHTGIIGPSRAKTISPLSSAVRRGMRFSIHPDNPVTPVNPLFAVWIAVNRKTSGGHFSGKEA